MKARYVCSADGARWEELEVLIGLRRLFHARISKYRSLPGWPRAVPAEIDVDAATHRLQVRMAEAILTVTTPTEEAR
jgi:hypothetical protein